MDRISPKQSRFARVLRVNRFVWMGVLAFGTLFAMALPSSAKPRGGGQGKPARAAARPPARMAARPVQSVPRVQRAPAQAAPVRVAPRAPVRNSIPPRAASAGPRTVTRAPAQPATLPGRTITLAPRPQPKALPARPGSGDVRIQPAPQAPTIVSEVTRPRQMYPDGFGAPGPRFDSGVARVPTAGEIRAERGMRTGQPGRLFSGGFSRPRNSFQNGFFGLSPRRCYPAVNPLHHHHARSCAYVRYPRCYPYSSLYWGPTFGYWGTYSTYEPTVIYRDVPYYVESPTYLPPDVSSVPAELPRDVPAESAGRPSEAGAATAEIPALVKEANALFADERYEEARELYLRVVLGDDGDGAARLLYGLSSVALGDHRLAAVAVRSALTTMPELVGDPFDLRSFYREPAAFERHLEAARAFARWSSEVGTSEESRDAMLLLGYLLFASAQAEPAAEIFEKLAEQNPEDKLFGSLRDAARNVLKQGAQAKRWRGCRVPRRRNARNVLKQGAQAKPPESPDIP